MDHATDTLSCADAEREAASAHSEVEQFEAEFHELSRIGIGLMREHDRKALLRVIVGQAKRLTYSDGGGLLLLEEDADGTRWLRPVLYAFDSIDGEFIEPGRRIPVDETSIVGHAALTRKPYVVADAYDLPPGAMYVQNVSFDEEFHYRRRSMLIVPMHDQLGHVLGVLVCINRKTDPNARIIDKESADRYVIEYSKREIRLARLLASLAAIAIENARLYAQVENMFDSFVEAAVSAIDLRDPTTAGHSVRVAELATRLAEDVARKEEGPYRDVRFTSPQLRELRFAALLHDIGKIAVPEELLLKSKKLPMILWARIDARFDLIRRTIELEYCRNRGIYTTPERDEALAGQLEELERFRDLVCQANEPTALQPAVAAELDAIGKRVYERPDGTLAPYLTAEELHYLRIPNGTFDDHERAETESHITATRDLLAHIPWTEDLEDTVTYAFGHHELLNGQGYPQRLEGDAIPLETRIITIADIFDALTARDRPYRHPMSAERALEMLRAEADAGRVDPEIVKVLTESRSYLPRAATSHPRL